MRRRLAAVPAILAARRAALDALALRAGRHAAQDAPVGRPVVQADLIALDVPALWVELHAALAGWAVPVGSLFGEQAAFYRFRSRAPVCAAAGRRGVFCVLPTSVLAPTSIHRLAMP